MNDRIEQHGHVDLAGGHSATHHLRRVLAEAVGAFPDALTSVAVPESDDRFKRAYPDLLPRFEATRAAAADRRAIAAALAESARAAIVWRSADGDEHPLAEHLVSSAEPLATRTVGSPGGGRLHPSVPFGGEPLGGDELVTAVRSLVERGAASASVADAIEWIVAEAGDDGIDLADRRIAVLGAAAELAPTRMWLDGGADVLWIDVAEPPADLAAGDRPGSLHWAPDGADLLTAPERIRATIEEFAGGEAVDVGLYAYAAGRAREWRLASAMNAIVDALPTGLVRGVAMLVSPTTCGLLTDAELDGEARRRRRRPRWQSALDRVGGFGRGGGHADGGTTAANRGIVSIQGTSYQAAQYLGKLIAAEVWATAEPPLPVSANTAGVSLTRSLHHPVFDVAFAGAAALGAETFAPSTTAHLNGLLTLHDRLAPDAAAADLDRLFATRVHGGIYELPYAIEPALRIAAALGVAKDPRRIGALLRRR